MKTRKRPELRELDCGLWQGLQVGEISKRFGKTYRQWREDPTSVCPPSGEQVLAAYERVTDGLEALDRKHRHETVVVVAARIVGALIEGYLTGMGLERLWEIVDRDEPLRVFEPHQAEEGTGAVRQMRERSCRMMKCV